MTLPLWRFVEAAHHGPNRNGPLRLFVVHTGETAESHTAAEGMANYFASGKVVASSHTTSDDDSIVQCVRATQVAYAAPGANHDGWQHEIAGRAGQTGGDWTDPFSDKALGWAALVAAEVVAFSRYFGVDIPLRHLTIPQIKDGETCGFAGHVDISKAFRKSTHWDPGPFFPMDTFLAKVEWWLGHDLPVQFR